MTHTKKLGICNTNVLGTTVMTRQGALLMKTPEHWRPLPRRALFVNVFAERCHDVTSQRHGVMSCLYVKRFSCESAHRQTHTRTHTQTGPIPYPRPLTREGMTFWCLPRSRRYKKAWFLQPMALGLKIFERAKGMKRGRLPKIVGCQLKKISKEEYAVYFRSTIVERPILEKRILRIPDIHGANFFYEINI